MLWSQLRCETCCVLFHQIETRRSTGYDKIEILGNIYTYYPHTFREAIETVQHAD